MASDLVNMRAGKHHSVDAKADQDLESFEDWADGQLYAAAQSMFEERLRTYRVTSESCGRCVAAASA